MPVPFYLAIVLILVFGLRAVASRREAWGIPAAAVLGTIAVWYIGDALYNDYTEYEKKIGNAYLESAWWQVCLFVLVFGVLSKVLHFSLNAEYTRERSAVVRAFETDLMHSKRFQQRVDQVGMILLWVWIALMMVAIYRVIQARESVLGFFAPYLTNYKPVPWNRERLGGGFDALLSFASYFQIFLTAAFGVVLALSRNPRTRGIALVVCLLAFPYFIFDRTRNTMLATMLPGILAWIFLRLRVSLPIKLVLLGGVFLIANAWFTVVLEKRSGTYDRRVATDSFIEVESEFKHLGLNMFEELAWVTRFIDRGEYTVNHGQRYFAELVNPIPRSLWTGKPLIGIDYAIARGQGSVSSANLVTATISTGMIGQGVTNFGTFFGPIAAAILMSLWVVVLAREDLLANRDPAQFLLYAIGLILTFNLGRDITLIVLYPYFMGVLCLWALKRMLGGAFARRRAPKHRRAARAYPGPPGPTPSPRSAPIRASVTEDEPLP